MRHKIVLIKEKIPRIAILPDGHYVGIWGGHVIEVTFDRRVYELETDIGVKGINIKVVVQVENGVATFEETKN